jgi:AcrR family transcriptional regulator
MTNAARYATTEMISPFDSEQQSTPNEIGDSVPAVPTWSVEEDVPPESGEPVIADQSGRPLGRRALETRKRILETTTQLLSEKSMRDLRVIDIARIIGSSPATFYQYFKDIEDVVLYLAGEINEVTPEMIEMIHGNWEGREGYERGCQFANYVIDHWERYVPILRVRNNAAEEGEGNPAFAEVRIKSMLPILIAFAEEIRTSQEKAKADAEADDREWSGGSIHPMSGAMYLLHALEGLTTHHRRFEKRFIVQGEGREQLVETVATIMQSVLAPRG